MAGALRFDEAIAAAAGQPGVLAPVGASTPASAAAALVAAATGLSPFLARVARREQAWLDGAMSRPVDAVRQELVGAPTAAAEAAATTADFMRALRVARRRLALAAALSDLGGVLDLDAVTALLSDFAEAAVSAAARRLLAAEAARGALASLDPARSGYIVLAMGKLGARELNYSSDIDLICLFDPAALAPADHAEAGGRFARLTKELVRQLATITEDGYVARVDLRLRPDPAATSPCVSTETAERYYEAMGRTWERAAHIKARPIAGDQDAGAAYLRRLTPFVWRRHLDFAAIEDASEMLARIRDHEGGAEIAFAGQDVKLGAGGIREIEFLAQTEQIILGGREPRLRCPRTREALAALSKAGRIDAETAAAVDTAYAHLRRLEHRLQMVEDHQTHRTPTAPAELERIAALMGAPSVAALEAETLAHMRRVRRAAAGSLDPPDRPGADAARDRSAAAAALFPNPERAAALAERWIDGAPRALRSPRAKERIRRLAPALLERLAASDDPMRAVVEFDRFLSGLPASVQLLSLLEATPWLMDLITTICAAAPRLSGALARRPALFDAVLDPGFLEPPPDGAALAAEAAAAVARAADYERALDAARRWASERRFQVGVGLLHGDTGPEAAQRAYSDIAEAALGALWPRIAEEAARLYGAPPGDGAAALALGKLGSREMTASSDLDLIMIYEAPSGAASEGPKPLAAPQYFARFTQLLVAAASAPTAEGVLYEIDMRLRPSGNSGPVATALEAFERYQREDAWLWEHMALTRARAFLGDEALRRRASAAIGAALGRPREAEAVRRAAREMRGKLDAAHPAALGRLWSLKYGRGGLIDLEFIAQTGLLIAGLAGSGGVSVTEAFERLAAAGEMADAELTALQAAHRLQTALLQIERVALDAPFDATATGPGLRALLLRAANRAGCAADNFEALERALAAARSEAAAAFERRIGRAA